MSIAYGLRDQRRERPATASCMVLKFTNCGTMLTMCTKVLGEWSTADCRIFVVKAQVYCLAVSVTDRSLQ